MSDATLCTIVGEGGVGESGASSTVIHRVTAETSQMMVLRTVASSLCPNTGAVATLLVNGVYAAGGSITTVGASIQAEAAAGDQVVGIVHTHPLFNDVVCIRLGELDFTLDECGLETVSVSGSSPMLSCEALSTDNWYAWNNKMPPRPDDFHITGQVEVPNPGVDVQLIPRVPQGFNRRILLLDLVATQRPGVWPQVVTKRDVRYEKVMDDADYTSVEVFCDGTRMATVDVETVS